MKLIHTSACVAVFAIYALAGCTSYYFARNEAPANVLAKVEEAERYYIEQAKKKAAFATGCELSAVEATTLQSAKPQKSLRFEGRSAYLGEVATAIGVDACGSKLVYNVICGVNKRYETTNEVFLSSAPCDLAQEGTAAEEAAISNNEEDAEVAQQQAAAAAAAAAAADK